MAVFLTKDEVVDLTGHERPAIQARWLRSNAIPFILGGDGHPKVPKQSLLDKIDGGSSDNEEPEAQGCGLVDVKENWDKVSESIMADILGTTRRALQGKRARAVLPEGVWSKVDGSILYSVKRYEAFLDAYWPAYTPVTDTLKPNATNLRRPRNATTTQAKPIMLLV
ncbi:DUF4224 domain-containing protein [Pseudomonas sp. LB3P93]